MSKPFKNKRVLLTDYYLKDPQLYQDIILMLSLENYSIFALLNVQTIQSSKFLEKFPNVIPILINTCRNFTTIENVEVDVNNVTFENGREKKLLENLPKMDHVINFAGPKFVEAFMETRNYFRVQNKEFGSLRSSLRSSTLISTESSYTIVNVVPDISLGESIRASLGMPSSSLQSEIDKHHVKEVSSSEEESKAAINHSHDSMELISPISRSSVLRRSMSLRIRKYIGERIMGERVPCFSETKQNLFRQETETLKNSLKQTRVKSISKYTTSKQKLSAKYEKKEQKLSRRVKSIKDEVNINQSEFVKERILSQDTVHQIEESRTRVAEREAIKSCKRKFTVESQRLENSFQLVLDRLYESWYTKLLDNQTKVIRKITKKYAEKLKAAERVFL